MHQGYQINHWQMHANREEERELKERIVRARTIESAGVKDEKQLSFVYAISGGGLIKFGRSACPEGRLRDLRIGSPVPLTLVAKIEGTSQVEALIHRFLDSDWSHGEWFRASQRVMDIVDLIKSGDHGRLNERLRQ